MVTGKQSMMTRRENVVKSGMGSTARRNTWIAPIEMPMKTRSPNRVR